MPKFVKYRRNSKGEPTKQVEISIETSNPREAVSLRAQGFHEVKPKTRSNEDDAGDQSGEQASGGDQSGEQPGARRGRK